MSTPPEKSASQNDVAVQLRRICETLLLGFAFLFLLAGIFVHELDTRSGPEGNLRFGFFLPAVIFFLLYLRSWWSRFFINTALYRAINDPSAVATRNLTARNSPPSDQANAHREPRLSRIRFPLHLLLQRRTPAQMGRLLDDGPRVGISRYFFLLEPRAEP